MSHPVYLNGWGKLAEEVDEELHRARAKFPSSEFSTTALTEEQGEAVRAVLEHLFVVRAVADPERDRLRPPPPLKTLRSQVRKELIQTIAMAIRLELEGDAVHLLPGSGE